MTSVPKVRDALYVSLMNIAVWVAPRNTREIHQEIISRGMTATHAALDARIGGYSEPPTLTELHEAVDLSSYIRGGRG